MSQKVSKYFFYLISVSYAIEGLVEVLVGSAWPLIAKTVGADISLIGVFTMISFLGSIVSSPNIYKIRKVLGTNYTMVLSMFCFIVSLIIYTFATNFISIALGAFINGIGIGLTEVNASSYVLKAYDAKEEILLFAFWGMGSVIGSIVMAVAVRYKPPYQSGFVVAIFILIINVILLLPAKVGWKKQRELLSKEVLRFHSVTDEEKRVAIKIGEIVKQKELLLILLSFFIVEGVIVTFNSFVSTIAFKQGMIGEVRAVEFTMLYFMILFFSRIIYGRIASKYKIINILRINSFIVIILFLLLFSNVFAGNVACVLILVIGFVVAPLIPLLNLHLKSSVDMSMLSPMLGLTDGFGVIGIIIISGLASLITRYTSINFVELFFVILMSTLYFLFR